MTGEDPHQYSTWGTKLSDRDTHFFEQGKAAGVAAERERCAGIVELPTSDPLLARDLHPSTWVALARLRRKIVDKINNPETQPKETP